MTSCLICHANNVFWGMGGLNYEVHWMPSWSILPEQSSALSILTIHHYTGSITILIIHQQHASTVAYTIICTFLQKSLHSASLVLKAMQHFHLRVYLHANDGYEDANSAKLFFIFIKRSVRGTNKQSWWTSSHNALHLFSRCVVQRDVQVRIREEGQTVSLGQLELRALFKGSVVTSFYLSHRRHRVTHHQDTKKQQMFNIT